MAFEYGCFISYAHPNGTMMKTFIEDLALALESELDPYVPQEVYIDRERLKPGYEFDQALSQDLCASACWIVVYVPEYAKRDYCQREFHAMQILDQRRRSDLGRRLPSYRSMIVPIVVRGKDRELPPRIRQTQYIDFKHLTLAKATISDSPGAMEQISELAAEIHEVYKLGEHLDHKCQDFVMPSLGQNEAFKSVRPQFPGDPVPNEEQGG